MSRCKTCREWIEWVQTEGGKSMPVDPCYLSVRALGSGVRATIVTDDGRVVTGAVAPDGDERGRQSHFASCPQAARHRKRC